MAPKQQPQMTRPRRRPGGSSPLTARRRAGKKGGVALLLTVVALVAVLAAVGASAQAATTTPATTTTKSSSGRRRSSKSSSTTTSSSGPVRSSSTGPVVSSSSAGAATTTTTAGGGGAPTLNGGPTLKPPRPSATPDEAFQRARSAQTDFAFFGQYLGPPGMEPMPGNGGGGGAIVPPPLATPLPPLPPLAPATPAAPPAAPTPPAPGGAGAATPAAPATCGPGQRTCGSTCCNGSTERCSGGTRCVPLAPPPPPPPSSSSGTTPPSSPAPPGSSGSTPSPSSPPPSSSNNPSTPPPPPPPPSDEGGGGGGGSPPAPAPGGSPSEPATFACGKKTQCNKGQQCIIYDDATDDVECCDASAVCKLDDEYTECCVDDQTCVIDDSDEEGKMRVCEDKKAVCGGRSDCNPDDGFVCVGDKVCCMDKDEKPCDPSGAKSRVCCDQTIYDCKMEDGQYDCFDKETAPSSGRRRKMLGVPAWARSGGAPSEARRAEERARRPWRTPEGRARRRAEQLARRRGQSLADAGRGFLPFNARPTAEE